MTDDIQEAARKRTTVMQTVLPVLIDRAGGEIEITREEFEAVAARYGGPTQMRLQFHSTPDGSRMRVKIYRGGPVKQGELPA